MISDDELMKILIMKTVAVVLVLCIRNLVVNCAPAGRAQWQTQTALGRETPDAQS